MVQYGFINLVLEQCVTSILCFIPISTTWYHWVFNQTDKYLIVPTSMFQYQSLHSSIYLVSIRFYLKVKMDFIISQWFNLVVVYFVVFIIRTGWINCLLMFARRWIVCFSRNHSRLRPIERCNQPLLEKIKKELSEVVELLLLLFLG